jgi:hypothetical protein
MPQNSWSDAAQWASYTKNRIPHKTTGKAPIELILHHSAEEERKWLRKFGEEVWVHDYTVKGSLSPRAIKARIVNYTNTKGVYWTSDYNGKRRLAKNPRPARTEEEPTYTYLADKELEDPVEIEDSIEIPVEDPIEIEDQTSQEVTDDSQTEDSFVTAPSPEAITSVIPKRHRRTAEEWTAIAGTRKRSDRIQQKNRGGNEEVRAVGKDTDHPTDEQARNGPYANEWRKARQKEREQLQHYRVYTKANRIPEGIKPVDTKWVYVIKRKPDGSIEKFKARKVGRGFSQEKGVNYNETYAQTARLETWRIVLAIALAKGWKFRQWDVVAAYLQAELNHTVYVTDTNENGNTEYWLLHKALYGLKQAAHEWGNLLKGILDKAGMQQCISDEGCFVSRNESAILLEHVDDLGAIAPTEAELDRLEQAIERHVELEKRDRKGLLGMEVTMLEDEVWLTQTRLIERTVEQVGEVARKLSLPTDPSDYTEPDENDELVDTKKYQQLNGSLLFLARGTRPEISIESNLLGRRAIKPSQRNYQAALKILGYLNSTKAVGLRIRKPESLEPEIIVDAAYPGEQARGTTGVVIRIGGQIVHWYTRRQPVASLSSSEAEYIAAAEGAKDASWLRQLLGEMKVRDLNQPIILLTDNDAAQKLTQNTAYQRRTRHIDNRYHYIRDQVEKGYLIVNGTPGKTNLADPLTKLISMPSLKEWMNKIGIKQYSK